MCQLYKGDYGIRRKSGTYGKKAWYQVFAYATPWATSKCPNSVSITSIPTNCKHIYRLTASHHHINTPFMVTNSLFPPSTWLKLFRFWKHFFITIGKETNVSCSVSLWNSVSSNLTFLHYLQQCLAAVLLAK